MIQQFSRLELSSQDPLLTQIGDSQIPSQFHDSPEIDKIDSMMIQNFKSFDKKYIGPFLGFTCIIGPNGSGKSNILDALMFCFCSQNSRHSLLDARQLINRQGKQNFKQLSKLNKICSVQATFILKNGEKFTICRTLDAEGKEQYLLNFKNVNKKVYQNVLLRKGINSNAPNYAIWQGQIDRLVLKDPLQLTNLLQNLSGSIYFKKAYQQLRQKLKQIQSLIEERTKKINKLKADRKNLKVIKQTSEDYNKYQAQYQQLQTKIYYLQVLQKERSIQDLEAEVKQVEKQEKRKFLEINQLKNSAQKDYAKKVEIQEQMNRVMAELAESYNQKNNVDNPANVLKLQKLKEAEQQIQKKQKEMQELKDRKVNISQNIPQIPPSTLLEEYLSVYQQWESENSSLHRQISKKKNQLLFVEGVLQSKEDLIKQFQNKKSKLTEKKKQKKQAMESLRNDVDTLSRSIIAMESESSKVSEQVQRFKSQFSKKDHAYQEVCSSIEQLESMVSNQAQDQKQAEMLKTLANIDGFHGALHQKIKPSASKYDICFSMMIGNMGKYLLCQSQDCAKKIGNRLKQIRLMKNVIILENVAEKNSVDIRKALGKEAVMGIDTVDFDQNTTKLKQFLTEIFYGKVVCDNVSTAYKIRSRNLEGVRQIYTLDGNVIRKDGVVTSHGNPESIKKMHKYSNSKPSLFQQISKLNKQKMKIESEMQNLKLKFDEKQLMRRSNEINEMRRKKDIMVAKLKQMQNEQDKQVMIPQSITVEIRELERQKDKLNKNVVELEKMIKSSKVFDKFLKKHKIDSLQTFRNANNVQYVESLMKRKNQSLKQVVVIDGQLEKIQRQLKRRIQEARQLEEQVKKIPEKGDKAKIERQIAEKEKQLTDLRTKISKLSIINRGQISFQSTLPAIQAKLVYAKQKIAKDLQELAYQLGIDYKYPIAQSEIIQTLNLPRKITDKVLESMSQKLQQERTKIQQHLDKHNSINLLTNVQEDEAKVEKGINGLLQDIQQAIKHRKKYSEEMENVRKDRATVFMGFVGILKGYLNDSYKTLTEQEDGSMGTVNLHVQNEDQPFEHGVYFTPTPPTKRFVYDLQQLSGGERSIASLALQYSLSLASKSPILILDETDAFLDTGNVNRFLKLINNCLKNHNIQVIVVTHKQGLFSKSESLVGVSRPKSLNLSQVYSLKLADD